jgi:DNA-binding response OmpR family regulator
MELRALTISTDYTYKDELQAACLAKNIIADYTKSMTEAIEMLAITDYCVIVIRGDTIDYKDGLKVLRRMKKMPILVFSFNELDDEASAAEDDVHLFLITSFNAEFLIKICSAMAKLYIEMREDMPVNTPPAVLTCRYLYLFIEEHQVFYKDISITLTKKEFDLLRYFMLNKGITLKYGQIYDNVWGNDRDVEANALHRLIGRLRKKLRCESEAEDFITSVWEVGYRFGLVK